MDRLDELELEKKYAGVALKFSLLADEIRLSSEKEGDWKPKQD